VIFDRFITEEQFSWRVQDQCPKAIRIVDSEDLHFLRQKREEAHEKGTSLQDIAMNRISLHGDITLRELASFYRSDLSLIISSAELQILENSFGIPNELLEYFPFCREAPSQAICPYDERKGFSFIGNFRHAPNADAVEWLIHDIWPLIRKELPQEELFIYGAYPPKKYLDTQVKAQWLKKGVRFEGWVPDASQVISGHRLGLFPLRFGAGLKGKVLESWQNGTPVVTTPIGAEGYLFPHELEPSTPGDLAQKAIELYTSEQMWEHESRKGLRRVCRGFLKEPLHRQFHQRLEKLKENIHVHRLKNTTGQILLRESMRSTKYFSKWIELKEKQS